MIASDVAKQYPSVKALVEKYIVSRGPYNYIDRRRVTEKDPQYDLENCNEDILDSVLFHTDPAPERSADIEFKSLSILAYDILIWEDALRSLGYPSSTINALLTSYEAELLKKIASGNTYTDDGSIALDGKSATKDKVYKNRLADQLNRYRQNHDPSLKPIMVLGECGAAEIGVTVSVDPPPIRLRFIPAFFFDLCKMQGLNPDDENSCDRWSNVVPGSEYDLSGEYIYTIWWTDHDTQNGRWTILSGDVDKIVVRKTGVEMVKLRQ